MSDLRFILDDRSDDDNQTSGSHPTTEMPPWASQNSTQQQQAVQPIHYGNNGDGSSSHLGSHSYSHHANLGHHGHHARHSHSRHDHHHHGSSSGSSSKSKKVPSSSTFSSPSSLGVDTHGAFGLHHDTVHYSPPEYYGQGSGAYLGVGGYGMVHEPISGFGSVAGAGGPAVVGSYMPTAVTAGGYAVVGEGSGGVGTVSGGLFNQGPDPGPTRLTPITGRKSKAKKGQPVHFCEHCGKNYTRAEHLRRHELNHQGTKIQCSYPDCPREFARSDLYKQHLAKHEAREQAGLNGSEGRPGSSNDEHYQRPRA